MPSKTSDPKFLRISTNGFVPLFDASESAPCKLLETQLKELAKGTYHDNVGPDKSLKGKSVTDLLGMIADGEIGFLQATPDKASLNLRLAYVNDETPTLVDLAHPKIFVTPAVIQPKLEGKKLMLRLDLRLELNNMLRPAACVQFLKALSKRKIEGMHWSFRADKKLDPLGYSCPMFKQGAQLLSFDTFATKKLLLAAASE